MSTYLRNWKSINHNITKNIQTLLTQRSKMLSSIYRIQGECTNSGHFTVDQNASNPGRKSKFQLYCVLYVPHLKNKTKIFFMMWNLWHVQSNLCLSATARIWGSDERFRSKECDVVICAFILTISCGLQCCVISHTIMWIINFNLYIKLFTNVNYPSLYIKISTRMWKMNEFAS